MRVRVNARDQLKPAVHNGQRGGGAALNKRETSEMAAPTHLWSFVPSADSLYKSIVNPDGLTLFVGLLLFFIGFTIFECCALVREIRQERSQKQQGKAE